jgi:hypothetical protein
VGRRAGPPPNAAPLVQVAETLGKRSRLATEIIKGVILPQFVILPLAVLLVWLALARGIAPLNELQQRIRKRDSSDLSPIDERDAPEEVSPLVRAINDLLARLDQSLAAQKHFLADAAHQLKTPLAGLRTQAELAQREIDAGEHDPKAVKRSLQQIALSSQRAAHMVNQLLAMARAEDKEHASKQQNVNLRGWRPRRCATSCRGRWKAHRPRLRGARHRRVAAAQGACAAAARAHPKPGRQRPAVHAGRPARSRVDASFDDRSAQDGGLLQVEDSGPGIRPAEREQVVPPVLRVLVHPTSTAPAWVCDRARDRGSMAPSQRWRTPIRGSARPRRSRPGKTASRFTLRRRAWPLRAPRRLERWRRRAGGGAPAQLTDCTSRRLFADRHQDAQPSPRRHHRGAAVADERQRHADHRQDAADHAHVDEGVGEEAERDGARQQPREHGRCLGRDHEATEYEEDEADQQPRHAHQTELLGEGGKDEVGGALGDELRGASACPS